jgi:hypothetical protein
MAGVYVEPHTPALGAVNPADVGAVAEAHTAAVQAAATLRDHYAQQVLGQGSQAGDLMPAGSTLTPPETNMRDGEVHKGPVSAF